MFTKVLKKVLSAKIYVWVVVLALVVMIAIFITGFTSGKIKIFNTKSESTETQVVTAMQKLQEVSVLGLSVTDIYDQSEQQKFFGVQIPLSEKQVFLKGTFDVKLGFDGQEVTVAKRKEHTYNISVPKFITIGISNPKFEIIDSKGQFLSFITKDIDTHKLSDQAVSDETLQKYVTQNNEWLQEQTTNYFNNIITAIDSEATITMNFQ